MEHKDGKINIVVDKNRYVKNMKKIPEKYLNFLLTNINKDVNIKYVVSKKNQDKIKEKNL